MAPLPENNTPCAFIIYTAGGQEHTALIRLPAAATASTAATAVSAMAAVMQNYMSTSDSILRARYRAQGSNVSLPISITPQTGTVAGTVDPDLKPNFTSWTGRSADGRDVKFTMFTVILNLAASGYRDRTPSTAENAILTALQSGTVDARTISGQVPTWNTYVNYGANSYWQRKIRRTS